MIATRPIVSCLHAAIAVFLAACLAGCAAQPLPRPHSPRPRVVSFSPAITTMLFDMGLGDHVVGVTNYCTIPPGQQRFRVGDAQNIDVERILSAAPDLLLVQQQPQRFRAVRQADKDVRVEHFRLETLEDVAAALGRLGTLLGKPDVGQAAQKKFRDELAEATRDVPDDARPKVLFVMGLERPGSVGKGTFLDEMIRRAGGRNAAGEYEGWIHLDAEYILRAAPDVVICWYDGAPEIAKQHYMALHDLPAAKTGRIYVVRSDDWQRPTDRLARLTAWMAEMIHPKQPETRR